MYRSTEQWIAGWSLRPVQRARLYRPEHLPELPGLLRQLSGGTAIARGRGTAYGDAALNDGSAVVDTLRLGRLMAFDCDTGRITCEAGTPLRSIAEVTVPRGWFLAVTPGTWKSTVGGCVACDVHGKNHHAVGSFGASVLQLTLALADATVVRCSRELQPELFWATVGGLGLTGVILDVELQLQRIDTSWLSVRYIKNPDLDATFAALEAESREPYSVAWLDVLARGRSLGRSVLMLGRHAMPEELPAAIRASPLAFSAHRAVRLPFPLPAATLSPLAARAFNALYFRRFPPTGGTAIVPFRQYFYPLEAIDNFPLLYGRRGLYEFQCAVPPRHAQEVLQGIIDGLSAGGFGSFLCVVKRLGPASRSPMSFPIDGYTLAVDIPARDPELLPALRRFDHLVAKHGGRVYLAKDARLAPELVDVMYPRRKEFSALVDLWDPRRLFQSSLSRRLRLREP